VWKSMIKAPMKWDTGIPEGGEAKGVAAATMISRSRSLMICSEMIWLSSYYV